MSHTPISLPVDRPFHLVIEVNPVYGQALFSFAPGKPPVPVNTGIKSVDLSIRVEALGEVDHE